MKNNINNIYKKFRKKSVNNNHNLKYHCNNKIFQKFHKTSNNNIRI